MAKKTAKKVFATSAVAAIAASAIVPTATFAAENNITFPDVENDGNNGWYKDAVYNLVNKGIIQGDDKGNFKPYEKINRASAAEIIAKAFGLTPTKSAGFSDVPADAWFAKSVNAVVEAGYFEGTGNNKFSPNAEFSRAQAAKVIVDAFELEGEADLSSFPDADEIPSWAKDEKNYVAIAVQNGIIEGKGTKDAAKLAPNDTITRAEFAVMVDRAITLKEDPQEEEKLVVESVSAINAKTLEVTFNQKLTVDEQKALEVSAKRDGSAVLVEFGEFEGNKATVVRTNGAEFASGEYVLTITGLGEETLTGEVTVEERTVTEAVVVNDHLLDETAKAKIGFELKDQYGEKVDFKDNEVTYSAYNKTQNKPVAISYNSTDGYYVDTTAPDADAFKVGDVVTVSLVHDKTGVSVSKDIEVVAGAQLNSITLGDIELPEGKTLLTEDLEDVKVPYTAYDQYGEEIELVKNGNVSVIVTDETVLNPAHVTFEKNSDDETYINIAEFIKAGKTNVILLNKVTGQTTVLPLEVNEKAGVPYSVEVAEGSVDIPANGGTKAVDLVVTDKYGNKVEPKDYVNAGFTVVSSNNSVATAAIKSESTDDNYGKLVIESVGSDQNRTARITVTLNATGKSAVVDVKVSEEAKPFDLVISKDSKHATSIVETGSTKVEFDVFDQYNNKYSNTPAGYTVNYKLKNNDESEFISLTGENNTLQGAEVTVNGLKAGSATLVAELKDGNDVVDTVEIPFTVVANSSEKFTYEVVDIPTLYKNGESIGTSNDTVDATEVGENTYGEEIKVQAVDANGSVVDLPASSILNVTPSTSDVIVGKVSGKWYVLGDSPSLDEDKVVTLTLNVRTDEGTKTITKDVTVSSEEAETVELSLLDKPFGNTDAKEVSTVKVDNYDDDIVFEDTPATGKVGYLLQTDQFGYTSTLATEDIDTIAVGAFDGITFAADDVFAGAAGSTITVTDTNGDTIVEANSSYRLTIIENGVALDIPVKVSAALADNAPTNPLAADFVITDAKSNDGKISSKAEVVTFSEPVKIEYKAVDDGDDAPANDAEADGITSTFVKSLPASTDLFTGLNITKATNDVYVRLVDQTGNKSEWVQISES
ncbi:S-layer homology domain-containing protein [Pallidibacillus thermolactis]|uniref:S-layer homology domain-containing protein n=1 Tax=Pallidibacillus thermolactis TaxID=251051 RepID=UPI002E235E24|nr:S-layer homology domain-containing protein [Pallidibacillus thermolactis subsp. kokeshiiformis]